MQPSFFTFFYVSFPRVRVVECRWVFGAMRDHFQAFKCFSSWHWIISFYLSLFHSLRLYSFTSRVSSHHITSYRFDIIKKLGQGTYGKVQLGINKETGQEVAIKTIKKSKIETEADLIRIRREVQIMSSVQHPNIIHIYEGELCECGFWLIFPKKILQISISLSLSCAYR